MNKPLPPHELWRAQVISTKISGTVLAAESGLFHETKDPRVLAIVAKIKALDLELEQLINIPREGKPYDTNTL